MLTIGKKREGVWENSKVHINPSHRGGFTKVLADCPKLPRVFPSSYVNTKRPFFYNEIKPQMLPDINVIPVF